MTDTELREEILAALTDVAPEADVDTLDPDTAFRDQIAMDSLDFVNLILSLEKRLEVKVPELDYPQLSTLNGCIAYLRTLTANRPKSNP